MDDIAMSMRKILVKLDELDQTGVIGIRIGSQPGDPANTKALFKRKGRYYLFDAEEKWTFNRQTASTREELVSRYPVEEWTVDSTIS